MVAMTSFQAVTASAVLYMLYSNNKKQDKPLKRGLEDVSTDEESDSSIKEVHVTPEKRSVRGENVYGPYKKVRRKNTLHPRLK